MLNKQINKQINKFYFSLVLGSACEPTTNWTAFSWSVALPAWSNLRTGGENHSGERWERKIVYHFNHRSSELTVLTWKMEKSHKAKLTQHFHIISCWSLWPVNMYHLLLLVIHLCIGECNFPLFGEIISG